MNRALKYKDFKGYFVVLMCSVYVFPLPLNFVSKRASLSVAYDVIFSVIAGLPMSKLF